MVCALRVFVTLPANDYTHSRYKYNKHFLDKGMIRIRFVHIAEMRLVFVPSISYYDCFHLSCLYLLLLLSGKDKQKIENFSLFWYNFSCW